MTEESGGLSPDVDDPPLSPTAHDVALPIWPWTRTSDSAHGLATSQLSHQPRLRLASSARETPNSVDSLRAHAYALDGKRKVSVEVRLVLFPSSIETLSLALRPRR